IDEISARIAPVPASVIAVPGRHSTAEVGRLSERPHRVVSHANDESRLGRLAVERPAASLRVAVTQRLEGPVLPVPLLVRAHALAEGREVGPAATPNLDVD